MFPHIWVKMPRKNNGWFHVLFFSIFVTEVCLTVPPGSLELGCCWTAGQSHQVINLAKSKCHYIFKLLFLTNFKPSHLLKSTVRAFDIIPKRELGLSISYHLVFNMPCDLHRHFLQIETSHSCLGRYVWPQRNAKVWKLRTWVRAVYSLQASSHMWIFFVQNFKTQLLTSKENAPL